MSNWYETGKKAEKSLKDEDERKKTAREDSRNNRIWRFWMPPESEQEITFLDSPKHSAGYDLPFVFREHNINRNGHWRNWFTCIDGVVGEDGVKQSCPLCEAGDKPYMAAAYTIIDHNEWTSKKDQTKHKDEKKLFVCKTAVQKTLARATAKKKSLRGWRCEVVRTSDESANTGDQFDWAEKVKLSKGEEYAPYDYHEVLAPKPREKLLAIVNGTDGDDGGESGGKVVGDDDHIPF